MVVVTYADTVATVNVMEFDGDGTIWLEQADNDNWIIINDSLQSLITNPITYTITNNGTYRVAVKRQYNNAEATGYSDTFIVDDIT